jgi:hypothetical protein
MAVLKIDPFQINDEGRRLLVNLAQHYDEWMINVRELRGFAKGRLTWKTVASRDYLYSVVDGRGNGTSLGPRSAETEATFDRWIIAKDRVTQLRAVLMQDAALYKALRLPRISSAAAAVLQKLDEHALLGTAVFVVGTNALAAYEIEASYRFAARHGGIDSTQDFDITWIDDPHATKLTMHTSKPGLEQVLKEVDSTYTINTERTFQIRNATGYEVEVLLPASIQYSFPANERIQPIPLREQDWLLPGTRVDHVVLGLDGTPARLVVPDPRLFALHKLWLSSKPGRDRNKVDKDRAQAHALLDAINEHMPHFPIDEAFRLQLSEELDLVLATHNSR